MPRGVSDEQLAQDFAMFFHNKVDTIRKQLENCALFLPPVLDVPVFSSFPELSSSDMQKIISHAKPATCDLDPIPSSIGKKYSDMFTPVITKIVNTSLNTGEFADRWKKAIVKPLLKKPSLEPTKNNYRPVSNLSFLSKLV